MEKKKKIIAITLVILTIASIVGFNKYREYQEDQYFSANYLFHNFVYNTNYNSDLTKEETEVTEENVREFMKNPEKYIKIDGTNGFFLMAQSFTFFTGRKTDWQLMIQLIYDKEFTKVASSTENNRVFNIWMSGSTSNFYRYRGTIKRIAQENGTLLGPTTPYEEIEAFLSEYSEEIEIAMAEARKEYDERYPPGSTFGYRDESVISSVQ